MSGRIRWVGFLAAAIPFIYSNPARAAWDIESVSLTRFGSLGIGDAKNDGVNRLYGGFNGNAYDGRLQSFTFEDGRWIERNEATAPGAIRSFAIGSDCGERNSLYLGFQNFGLIKMTATPDGWANKTLRAGHGDRSGQGHSIPTDSPTSDVLSLQTTKGRIWVIVEPDLSGPEFKCGRTPWGPESDPQENSDRDESGAPRYYHIATAGDARGDGIRRYYGFVEGSLFELEKIHGRWSYLKFGWSSRVSMERMVIADVRNDGHPALLLGDNKIMEYRWSGTAWTSSSIGVPHSTQAEFFVGKIRHDGRTRIYYGKGEDIMELTFGEAGWRSETIAAHKGSIISIAGGRVGGQRESLYFSVKNGGLYRLGWRTGEVIAVAAFRDAGVPAHEADRFTEALTQKILETGNCTVVERRKIDAILREHKLEEDGVLSSKNAIRLGRLLGADKVVVGSVGRLYDSYAASANSVSVDSGIIVRSELSQWKTGDDIEKAVEKLGVAVCPSGQGFQ